MISIEGWSIRESTKNLAFSYLFCGVYCKVNSNNLFCGVYYKVNSNNVSIIHTLKNSSMQPYSIKLCL
jgi:hypothetical protein